MSDTVYNVITRYQVETGQATAGINRLSAAKSNAFSVTSRLTGAFDGLVGKVVSLGSSAVAAAGSLGVALLTREIIGLNSAAESATIGIAGMIQAGGGARNFSAAMEQSQSIITQMRRDAAALPGSFEDLQNVFQGGLLPGIAAGKTAEQVENLAARFMSVGKVMNVQSQVAGRELAMMLEGRAGAHVVMWSRLAPLVGKTAQEFNKMTTAERFEAVSRALNGFDPAIQAYADTWDAVSSTTKDTVTNFLRLSSGPVFTRIKNDLLTINNYVETHQDRVNDIARTVGDRLVGAYDRVKNAVLFIRDHHREIAADARDLAERVGGAALVGRGALGLMSSGAASAVGGVVGGGALGGGLMIGAVMAPLAIAVANGSVSLTRFKADVDAVLIPFTHGLKGLFTVVRPVADAFGRLQFSALEGLLDRATQLANGFDFLATAAGNLTDTLQNRFGNYIGTFWDEFTTQLGRQVRMLSYLIPGLGQGFAAHDLYTAIRGPRDASARLTGEGRDDPRLDAIAPFVRHALAENPRNRRPEVVHRGNMTVTVRIEQTVNDASDPQRVYLDTRKAIWDAILRPHESPRTAVLR